MGITHALIADGDPLVGAYDWNGQHAVVWDVPTGSGAPVDPPAEGELPLYINVDFDGDLYVFTGGIWYGPFVPTP